jgi:hypothetical protein
MYVTVCSQKQKLVVAGWKKMLNTDLLNKQGGKTMRLTGTNLVNLYKNQELHVCTNHIP